MARDLLTYKWTSTGIKTLSLGAQPTKVRFTVSQKDSASDTVLRRSDGTVTDGLSGTWEYCESIYADSTSRQSYRFDDRIVSHYERVGGVLTEVLKITFDSWTATGMKVNVVTCSNSASSPGYIVTLEFET